MGGTGIILNDMGMERMNDLLLRQFIKPLAELLFPDVRTSSTTVGLR